MFDDMNRFKFFAFTGLLVLLLSVTSVPGTTVRLLNLFEMVQLADRVFWGEVSVGRGEVRELHFCACAGICLRSPRWY